MSIPTRPYVEVRAYTDLPAAGGTLLGIVGPWIALSDTLRTDGDDRLEGTIATTSPGASHLEAGVCLVVTETSGTVRDWLVQTVRDDLTPGTLTIAALSARVWLAERVLVRDGTDVTLSGSAALEDVIDTLVATDEWPAWAVPGTFDVNPTIAYSWSLSNGLAACTGAATAADASEEVALAGDTVRFAFRRVSASAYALDFLTSVVSGSPVLAQGKNVTSFAIRDDRTQQPTAIYPVNSGNTTIAEAMFAVRTVASNTFDVRDWAYRDDFLAIAFDDQWVGYYAVAPDGTTSIITSSDAATQQISVADASAWGSGNNATVRFSPVSGGDVTLAVVDTAAIGRRNQVLSSGAWSAKINWLPNSRMDQWASSTVVKDWATTGGMTTNQLSTAGNFETGLYGVEIVTGGTTGAFTVSEVLMPDEVVSNNGGTQTWRVGLRYKRTANTGASVLFERSVNNGASWTTISSLGSSATFATVEGTFTTTAAIHPDCPRLRITTSATAGSKYVIDRFWLFRDGVEDDDNTYIGNGPSVGFYTAQRALLRARTAGRAYEIGIADRTRDNPTAFPNDALAPGMTARVIVPARSVDVQQTVAEVRRDLLQPLTTSVQLGAARRKLTKIV